MDALLKPRVLPRARAPFIGNHASACGIQGMGKAMTMPNFLIIGAMKCGTTSLYHYLGQHPDIYMSPVKEPCFFAFENQSPDFRNLKGHLSRSSRMSIKTLEAYQALFKDWNGEKAVGEASPHYLFLPAAVERIKFYIPEAKLIAILRNPIDRAYSAYLHAVRDGHETARDFAGALALEERRIRTNCGFLFRYTSLGLYHEQIKRYFDAFDPAQIRVYLYDDLKADLSTTLQDIFRFLEVDASFVPNTSTRHNKSGIAKSLFIHRATNVLLLKSSRVKHLPAPLKAILASKILTRVAMTVRNRNLHTPALDAQTLSTLRTVFHEDILRLQDLIGRDLSHWLAPVHGAQI